MADLIKKVARDAKHGYALPIFKSIVKRIKGALVQPCRLAAQFTLTASGLWVLKDQLTQDLSFAITGPNTSINNQVDMSAYPEMIYGFCLLRLIQYIVALHLAFPDEKIFIANYNFSDVYRRISYSAAAAAQTMRDGTVLKLGTKIKNFKNYLFFLRATTTKYIVIFCTPSRWTYKNEEIKMYQSETTTTRGWV